MRIFRGSSERHFFDAKGPRESGYHRALCVLCRSLNNIVRPNNVDVLSMYGPISSNQML